MAGCLYDDNQDYPLGESGMSLYTGSDKRRSDTVTATDAQVRIMIRERQKSRTQEQAAARESQ